MHGQLVNNHKSFLLFLTAFVVTLVVSFSTHIFEVPDENAHYATVHYLNDQGRMPTKDDLDTHSLDLYKTEELMGTLEGENKYSYHPEYRIEQIAGPIGKYETLINSLNTKESTSTYSGRRAAIYPPLYYQLAQPFYAVTSGGSLIDRLFHLRLLSVLLTAATVYYVYKIGSLITESDWGGVILSILYILYPMTTYVGGGVNPDNLHNLFTTIFIYLSLRAIYKGWNYKISLTIGTLVGLDLLTKPQAYILLPILLLVIIISYKQFNLKKLFLTGVFITLPILTLAGYQEIPKIFNPDSPYVAESNEIIKGGSNNFVEFSKSYFRTHLTEMPVWYWGVFKWFGLVLPKPIWWLATRILAIAALGIFISLWHDPKAKKISNITKFVIFSLGANIIYAAALFWFDWQFYQQFGRSLGLQARYYMPLLSTQLALIYLGIKSLTSNVKYSNLLVTGLLLFFLVMHLVGFYTQLTGYYDMGSLRVFVDQLSQYKPIYAKGDWWYLWFALYSLSIITLLKIIFTKKYYS